MIVELELTIPELNLVMAALGELPAKSSMGLILKLQQQYNDQKDTGETYDDKDDKELSAGTSSRTSK
jgi:hypothetical protein